MCDPFYIGRIYCSFDIPILVYQLFFLKFKYF